MPDNADSAKPDTRPRCQTCGAVLSGGYWENNVSAVQQQMSATPDGTAMRTIVRSALACSWRCLLPLVEALAEPNRDEDPF